MAKERIQFQKIEPFVKGLFLSDPDPTIFFTPDPGALHDGTTPGIFLIDKSTQYFIIVLVLTKARKKCCKRPLKCIYINKISPNKHVSQCSKRQRSTQT